MQNNAKKSCEYAHFRKTEEIRVFATPPPRSQPTIDGIGFQHHQPTYQEGGDRRDIAKPG